ncbi:hypothetical protein V498_07364 [Pseudogymnoascus sp. VKM F-4517 (FW-2822)]|nr:hypothetical protein V498_07364 [Pseudogymnoascus sp. VKM F-4517 (FW-2822)]
MANPTNFPDLQVPGGRMHDDQELCEHLLRSLDRPALLEILPSKIDLGGTGLFAKEDCQRKAWRKYHKLECPVLGQHPHASAEARALYRLIAMVKQDSLSEQEWRALAYLKAHEEQWSGHLEDLMYYQPQVDNPHRSTPLAFAVAARSAVRGAETLMQPGIDNLQLYGLYFRILTNDMDVAGPLHPNIGRTVDLVGSLMNHSCDPNTFAFFEGRQLRVRSLKPIQAGEEITVSYVDAREGFMMRHDVLWFKYFIDCKCNRCEEEELRISTLMSQESSSFEDFYQAEKELIDIRNEVSRDYKAFRSEDGINQVKTAISTVVSQIFRTQPWPDTLLPMCHMKQILAELSFKLNTNPNQIAIYTLQSCFGITQRSGPHWVYALHSLATHLTPMTAALNRLKNTPPLLLLLALIMRLLAPPAPPATPPDCPATPRQFWDFYNGLLYELVLQSRKTYGTDSACAVALVEKYARARARSSWLGPEERPLPGERGFAERFGEAQVAMLGWAGVDGGRGLEMS